jgi:hypothetical protein
MHRSVVAVMGLFGVRKLLKALLSELAFIRRPQ